MALNTPPEPGSFRYVLRTLRPYDPTIPRTASTYDETVESRDITHKDGIRHPTIFLNTQTARDRLVREGWEDVTDKWNESTDKPAGPVRVKIKA